MLLIGYFKICYILNIFANDDTNKMGDGAPAHCSPCKGDGRSAQG